MLDERVVLEMLDERLRDEVAKVKLLRGLVDVGTNLEDAFLFSDDDDHGSKRGLFKILDDLVHAFDDVYVRIADLYVEATAQKAAEGAHADGH